MKAIEHIIVPVDFYTHSDLQAGFALAIAATFGARITFVHIMRRVVDYTDFEPETLARMNAFAAEQGYAVDFSETRFHHELYLSDPNRTAPEKRKTILRHPLKSSL